jgi:JmjC domain, hydroxylase/SET domain
MMSDLMVRIQSLEASLNEITSILNQFLPRPNTVSTRKQTQRQTRQVQEVPAWAMAITLKLNLVSTEVQHIKEAVQKSPGSHGSIAGTDDQAPPDSQQRTPGPLPTISKQPSDRGQLRERAPTTSRARNYQSTNTNPEADASDSGKGLEAGSSSTSRLEMSTMEPQSPRARTPSSQDSDGSAIASYETAVETTPKPHLLIPPALRQKVSSFSLSVEEMGDKLVPNVILFLANPAFTSKISIKNIPDVNWTDLATSTPRPPEDYDLIGVTWSQSRVVGAANLNIAPRNYSFPGFPDFSHAIKPPSLEESLNYLDQLISDPPKDPIPYYVGPPLDDGPSVSILNSILHPGQRLLQIGPIRGLNEAYWHWGPKGSGTPWHCEDIDLWSFNAGCIGWKLWLEIPESHTAAFEAFVRKHWPTNNCDQFARHPCVVISPKTLKRNGIKFKIDLQGPGELKITRPRSYHMVVNVTDSFATAINFLPPDEPIVPRDTNVCPRCGLYSLKIKGIRKVPYAPINATELNMSSRTRRTDINTNANSRIADSVTTSSRSIQPPTRKRQNTNETLRPQTKTKRTKPQVTVPRDLQNLDAVKKQISSIDKLCKFPLFNGDPPTLAVFTAVAAIWSRPAIEQFCSLVKSTRDLSVRVEAYGDQATRVEQHIRGINISRRQSMLGTFLLRLYQLYLAEEIDSLNDGRVRMNKPALDGILARAEWKYSTLRYHRDKGRTWRRICGDNNGLLCFIFLDAKNSLKISPDIFIDMTPDDLKIFHQLLKSDYTTSICSAGKAFQNALNSEATDADFLWEGSSVPVHTLSEERLLASLQLYPSNNENIYDKDKYPDWPRPTDWPKEWDWLIDPTSLNPNERQCEMCFETTCCCIDTAQRTMPRIKDYGGKKKRGLQAVAERPGQIAYKKGDIIGQYTGELVPLGTKCDGWALELWRTGANFPFESSLCQIYAKERGNCFRLLNHHCNPNAICRPRAVSGRCRLMIEAKEDIRDGKEITIDYGPDYWGSTGCPCDAPHHRISQPGQPKNAAAV